MKSSKSSSRWLLLSQPGDQEWRIWWSTQGSPSSFANWKSNAKRRTSSANLTRWPPLNLLTKKDAKHTSKSSRKWRKNKPDWDSLKSSCSDEKVWYWPKSTRTWDFRHLLRIMQQQKIIIITNSRLEHSNLRHEAQNFQAISPPRPLLS